MLAKNETGKLLVLRTDILREGSLNKVLEFISVSLDFTQTLTSRFCFWYLISLFLSSQILMLNSLYSI